LPLRRCFVPPLPRLNQLPSTRHHGCLLPARRQASRLPRACHGCSRLPLRWCLPRHPRWLSAQAGRSPNPGFFQGRGDLHPGLPEASERKRGGEEERPLRSPKEEK
ncbi:hypothetical protein ANOM_008696, partial [Aspergillus nomiae NRRL 13137]